MRLCTIQNGGKAVVGVKTGNGKIIDLSKQMPRGPKSVVEILAEHVGKSLGAVFAGKNLVTHGREASEAIQVSQQKFGTAKLSLAHAPRHAATRDSGRAFVALACETAAHL